MLSKIIDYLIRNKWKLFLYRTLRPAKDLTIEDFQVSVGIIKNDVISVSLSGAINIWKYSADMNDVELPVVSANGHQVHNFF